MGTAAARNALSGSGANPRPVIEVGQDGTPVRRANTFKPFSVTVASLGIAPQTVWTPATGRRFRLLGYTLTSNKAASVQFRDGSVATILATGALVANTPAPQPVAFGDGYRSASANNLLQLDVDTAVPVIISGTVWGTEE